MTKKHIALTCMTLLFLISCSVSMIDIQTIKVINYYEDNEKNIQLAKDIVYQNYMPKLAKLLPDITEEDAKFIRWEYFIKESDKEISLRLKLDLQNKFTKKNKDRIVEYFTTEFEDAYQLYTKNSDLFVEASNFAITAFNHLSSNAYDQFWDICSPLLKDSTSKDSFIKQLKEFNKMRSTSTGRQLSSKQLYKELSNGQKGIFISLNYVTKSENNKEIIESLTVEKSSKWVIVGYQFSVKNH